MNIPNLSFLLLTALADQPRHGYSMLQEIDVMTSGESKPPVATLYRTLDRLASDGYIEEAGSEVIDGRFRRIYKLTDSGASLLLEEAKLRASTARLATKRLRQTTVDPAAGLAGGLA